MTSVYQDYWNLRELPFENVPDPRFFYPATDHQRALLHMFYAIDKRMGAAVLTGDTGCGKTVLSRILIQDLSPDRYAIALMTKSGLSPRDFLRDMLNQLGVETQSHTVPDLRRALEVQVVKSANAGKYTVVLVDEAQAIEDDDTFSELQSLFSFQRNDRFFLTLLLIGQPDLNDRIARHEPLAKQVARESHLAPLEREETHAYVQTRLKQAGLKRPLFDRSALDALYGASKGIPREINNICDIALLLGFGDKAESITADQIAKAVYATQNL